MSCNHDLLIDRERCWEGPGDGDAKSSGRLLVGVVKSIVAGVVVLSVKEGY